MTTPTPTSDHSDALAGIAGLTTPQGFPDIGTLSQLANEFFASLPGASLPVTPAAAPATSVPAHVPALSAPADATTQLPVPPLPASPLPTVPPAFAVALPSAGHTLSAPAVGAPSSPYYFITEATSQAASQPGVQPSAQSTVQPLAGSHYFADPGLHRLDRAPDVSDRLSPRNGLDINAVRRDFPVLAERVNGKPLVWFDNAATTQKPRSVIERISYFYEHENSNIHRAAHELAARSTDAYEGARNKVARFLGARSANEIIFVRGATEGINLIANTFGRKFIGEGDEIVVSHLEHHANIVPWQQLAAEKGAALRVIPVDDSGQVILGELSKLLNNRTKLVSVTQVSNALGTVVPVQEIIAAAHRVGAKVVVDGAQAVSHLRVNVQALDADFYVFSGHKVFGPTGIGVVYGKQDLLEQLPPWQGGGNMIADVTFDRTIYQGAPARFEAGTGNIADAVGLGAAIDYVERVGLENIQRYEHDLLVYATHHLQRIPGLQLIGTAADKASVLSFVLAGYRTEEVGSALNQEGIAVRSGHHCAQPILRRFGLEATVRPSLAFYNTCDEVDLLVSVVRRLAQGRGAPAIVRP